MTEKKPPGVSWESWIDQQIRAAREGGAFDDLPGAGKPLADLGEHYDPDWWAKKLVRREGISMWPPALELRRKVESALASLWTLRNESEVRTRVAALNAEIATVNATAAEGPSTSLAPLDVEAIVEEWRRRATPGPS